MSFKQFIDTRCNVCIETGTYNGDTTIEFAEMPNFTAVYTIELSEDLYQKALQRFGSYEKISGLCGDSGVLLSAVLESVNTLTPDAKVMLLLDSHYSGGNTARGTVASPLRQELVSIIPFGSIIQQIIIDDFNVCAEKAIGNPLYVEGFPPDDEVYELVKQILVADYDIKYDPIGRPLGIMSATRI